MTTQAPPVGAGSPNGGEAAAGMAAAGRRWWFRPVWILPAVVVVVVLVMTALGISGSSVASLGADPARDGSLLVGDPLALRSDEWNTRTPLVMGQVEDGLARESDVGVGRHDMSVLYDLPTADWSMTFRPHLWGYLVLPVENAFAFEWWAIAGTLVLGVYALVLVLVRDWRWATVTALGLYGSPFFHWWYLTSTFAVVGYAAAGGAALLASLRPTRVPWHRWALVGLAAFLLAAFAVLLYPPFQVPVAMVVGLVGAGTVARWVLDGEVGWRRLVVNLVVVGGLVGLVVGLFALTRSGALEAIANTAYPGRRRIQGGDGQIEHLATAWYGWDYIRDGDRLGPLLMGNSSEASGFLLLGVYLLAALPLVWASLLGPGRRLRFPVIGAVVAVVLLLLHAYVGLPSWLTRITLLDRVQTNRAIVGLGVGSILLLALAGVTLSEGSVARWRRIAAGVVLVAVTAGYVLTLGQRFRDLGGPIGRVGVAATVLVAVVIAGTYFWKPLLSVALLAAYGIAVSLPVNPVYQGLAPLEQQPLVGDLAAAADDEGPSAWLATNGDVNTVLVAQGYEPLSGVNLYPDAEGWRILDPTGSAEEIWNRYAHTTWGLVPGQPSPVISLLAPDVVSVTIDPCGPELDELGIGHVATDAPLEVSCLTLDRMSSTARGAVVYLYDRAVPAR